MSSSGVAPVSRSRILQGDSDPDAWCSLDQFYRDHVHDVLAKLPSLDDGIWGKLILMEKNRRLAKAYLRTPSIQLDGSDVGFDGNLIGYNSFVSPTNDLQVAEIRSKICSGVVMKIDRNGNVLAKRRGRSPVIVQETLCSADSEVAKLGGRRLDTHRFTKVFDMRSFKETVDSELSCQSPDRDWLLYNSAVRVSLVKEVAHPLKTPCWLMLINIVAVEVFSSKWQALQIPATYTAPICLYGNKPTPRKAIAEAQCSKQAQSVPLQQPSVHQSKPPCTATTVQRPQRSELTVSFLSDQSPPSTESGLDGDEEDTIGATAGWHPSMVLSCDQLAAASKQRFGHNFMLGKLKPQFWHSVVKGDLSSYESSVSSCQSTQSNSPSYSSSILSDCCSEAPTSDSGFLETRFENHHDKGAEGKVKLHSSKDDRLLRCRPTTSADGQPRSLSKSCVEICRL